MPRLFDLTGRGEIVLSGKDRASYLHGLITNDVKSLKPGTGCYAAFLTPKGKMLADLTVLCMEDEILIDCDADLADKLESLLRKYLVFNEVTIENRTANVSLLHIEGKGTEDFLRMVLRPGQAPALPETPHAHVNIQFPIAETVSSAAAQSERLEAQPGAVPAQFPIEETVSSAGASAERLEAQIVREPRGGSVGFDIRIPRVVLPSLLSVFKAKGLSLSPLPMLEAARIDAGIPRWGFELDETVLPDEAGFRERGAISYTKGCYIGQETVARIKTYGHVNRSLVRLAVAGAAPPPGSEILFEGEKTGSVTSAAATADGQSVALGYVKRERAAPGTKLTVRTPADDLDALVTSQAGTTTTAVP